MKKNKLKTINDKNVWKKKCRQDWIVFYDRSLVLKANLTVYRKKKKKKLK